MITITLHIQGIFWMSKLTPFLNDFNDNQSCVLVQPSFAEFWHQ